MAAFYAQRFYFCLQATQIGGSLEMFEDSIFDLGFFTGANDITPDFIKIIFGKIYFQKKKMSSIGMK